MKGYKVFNEDWTCRGFKYEVGKTYSMPEGELSLCKSGFHFCTNLADCFNYYSFNPENRVAEVEALGKVVSDPTSDDSKLCTNKIHILKEISWTEVLILCNTGNCNTGNRNTGNRNTGDWNTGDWNTGNCNTGDCNTGDWNTGDWNTGDRNTGNCNTGNRNTGNCNTGDWNTGDWNTGDWNTTDRSPGCFNTVSQPFYMFNKPTVEMNYFQWRGSGACHVLEHFSHYYRKRLDWVFECDMTAEEKTAHPEYTTTGGYLKVYEDRNPAELWDGLSDELKNEIKGLPNFDAEIFKECTGIDVYERRE